MPKKSIEQIEANEPNPSIEPGEYEALCTGTDYGPGPGVHRKLFIKFSIYGSKYDGTMLFMACNKPSGKLTGNFKVYKQWCLAIGRLPYRGERLNKDIFKGKMYKVLVRDTKRRHSNGMFLPGFMQYSVVDTILEPLTGVPHNES